MKHFVLVIFCLFFCACNDKAPVEIYHTGAISGYFYERTLGDENKKIGGLPALKNLFSQKETPFLLFDSGDLFSTTQEGQIAKLSGSLKLLSSLPYTAITLSAEDLKFGASDVENALKNNKLPIVISNLKRQDGKIPNGIKDSLIIDFEGVKWGILGVLSKSDFDKLPRVGNLRAEDEIETLKTKIETLKTDGVNIIILLSSLGFEREDKAVSDKILLDELTGIDLLLGIGKKENIDSSKTFTNQAPDNLQQVSLLKLQLNKNKQISSFAQENMDLNISQLGQEENLLKEINTLRQQTAKNRTKRITKLDVFLDSQGQNSALGSYTAACLKKWGKTNIGLINFEALGEGLPQGDITEENLYKAFPFDDKVMFLKIYGTELLQALQNNLNSSRTAILSGIKVYYNDDKNITKVIIDGQPLKGNQLYDIALPDHLIGNVAGYEDFLNMYEFKNTDRTVRGIVTWCLNNKNTEINNENAWQKI